MNPADDPLRLRHAAVATSLLMSLPTQTSAADPDILDTVLKIYVVRDELNDLYRQKEILDAGESTAIRYYEYLIAKIVLLETRDELLVAQLVGAMRPLLTQKGTPDAPTQ